MKVSIRLNETSQPIELKKVTNTYEKGSFYCCYIADQLGEDQVLKFPIDHIFQVKEDYGFHA